MFIKYQHIEKLGNTEVKDIELGRCYVFPKIDGTNGSVWVENGLVCFGSRNRELTLDNDNAGFMAWGICNDSLMTFAKAHPELRLYGEWLVPHSLRTYRKDAWRRFYIFDVSNGERYLSYDEYKPLLDEAGLDYIAPIAIINKGSYQHFIEQLAKNVFLIEDGKGVGEGVIIKRYDYVNKYGRTTWAKIITSEFKEKHVKEMGAPESKGTDMIEDKIVDAFVTPAFVEKEYAKIAIDGWSSKMIPQLLNTVFYVLVKEECWEFVKQFKFPEIDFKLLRTFTFEKVKKIKSDLF